MTAELYHGQFCRNPLHPGPCKGWKKGTPKAVDAPAKPTPAKKAAPAAKPAAPAKGTVTALVKPKPPARVTPPSEIGKPSRTGRADFAVSRAAMDKDWKAHNDSLSKDQKKSAYDYTTSDYLYMNRVLGKPEGEKLSRDDKRYLKQSQTLQGAMAPAPRGTKVYRGAYLNSIGLDNKATLADVQALVGKTLVNDGFTSTTVKRSEIFAGNLEMEIEVPKGTPSLWLNGNSQLPNEQELLLAAGAKIKVLAVEEIRRGEYKIRARIVP